MKTKLIIIGISAFLLSAMFASAQQNNVSKADSSYRSNNKGPYYIDKNKDGICDNWQPSKKAQTYNRPNYVDKNKDGICDNRKSSKTAQNYKCQNYVDKNKDGVCDNRQNENAGNYCRKGHCCGKGKGNGYQHRHGWKK
jgi:hypothetical protein